MASQNEHNIDFNPQLFNPIYWEIKELIHSNEIRYIWIYGGSSASKTFSVVQALIIFMLSGNDNNSIIFRKIGADLKDSIYADFKSIIREWELNSLFIIQEGIIKCTTGSYCRFRGMDDPERVKGLTGYKKVVMEEVSQFEEEDYKQMRKRLRGKENQQIIAIFNPINEDHWIKKHIFDADTWINVKTKIKGRVINAIGNTAILHTNYKDNTYIVGPNKVDQHVIDDFERDKELDYQYYMIYAEGEWGQIKTGKEYYPVFSTKHIKEAEYDSTLPLHITYDFNVMPYMTLLVFQIVQDKGCFVIKGLSELCMPHPNNTTRAVTEQFCAQFKSHKLQVFFYGDFSGRGRISGGGLSYKNEMVDHQFDIIKAVLRDNGIPFIDRVIPNKAITKRRDFVMDILNERIPIKFQIAPSMIQTKSDFMFLKQGADGLKFKQKVKDDITGATYEKYGHPSDATEYLITSAFESDYEDYISKRYA